MATSCAPADTRHMGHADLLGKLRMSTSTDVSPAKSDYKCKILWLTTTKGAGMSLGARYYSIMTARKPDLSYPLIQTYCEELGPQIRHEHTHLRGLESPDTDGHQWSSIRGTR